MVKKVILNMKKGRKNKVVSHESALFSTFRNILASAIFGLKNALSGAQKG